MRTVTAILKAKGNATYSITPDSTVYEALQLMVEKNIGAVLVIENGKLKGMFTEREYARKVILEGKSSRDTTISEIMIETPLYISPNTTIDECMNLMTGKFLRHLPVLEDDEIVGIISIGDVVKYVIDEQQFIIQNMEHYIAGI